MMTKKIVFYNILTLFVACLSLMGCKDDDVAYVRMSKTTVTLHPNDSYQFQVLADGGEVFFGSVTWTIVEETPEEGVEGNVITMDETGLVTGHQKGEARIKATLQDGRYLLAVVSVADRNGPDNPEFSFEQEAYYINPSTISDSLVLNINPDLMKLYPLEFISSDESVLLVDDPSLLKETTQEGTYKLGIHPLNVQQDEPVIVTAKLGNATIECKVYVKVKLYMSLVEFTGPDIVEIDQSSFKFTINNDAKGKDTIVVYYRSYPDDDNTLANLDFKVSTSGEGLVVNKYGMSTEKKNEFIVVVTSGGVPGNAVVTVEAEGRKVTANCEVYDKYDYAVESVTMLNEQYTIEDVLFYDLLSEVEVAPFGITDYWPIEWSSSNERIATVANDGHVVFLSPGVVDIIATARDKSAKCQFNVLLKVSSIEFNNSVANSYYVGESAKFETTIKSNVSYVPEDRIKWSSSNEQVATVDEMGVVSANSAGSATITASITDDKGNTFKAEKTIEVIDAAGVEIYDLVVDNRFIYYQETNIKLDIYIEDELGEENFQNYLSFTFDRALNLSQNHTYTVGDDLAGVVLYNATGTTVNLLSGTLKIQDGKMIFNLKVGIPAKQVTISGEINI